MAMHDHKQPEVSVDAEFIMNIKKKTWDIYKRSNIEWKQIWLPKLLSQQSTAFIFNFLAQQSIPKVTFNGPHS